MACAPQGEDHIDARQHQHEIRGAHERIVDPASAIARSRPHPHAKGKCEQAGTDRDAEREARAKDEPRHYVAPEAVAAEREPGVGAADATSERVNHRSGTGCCRSSS